MTKGLKRYYGQGQLHFLTFSCYRRLPLLESVRARNLLVEELRRVRMEYGFLLVGYVVMPNHVHLLLGEPKKSTLSTVLQMLKQRVSKKLRKLERSEESHPHKPRVGHPVETPPEIPFPKCVGELPKFWEPRFYDFNVYSHHKKKEKLDYMHANPVTRGLVQHPKDWPWSSFLFYAKDQPGLVPIDPVD